MATRRIADLPDSLVYPMMVKQHKFDPINDPFYRNVIAPVNDERIKNNYALDMRGHKLYTYPGPGDLQYRSSPPGLKLKSKDDEMQYENKKIELSEIDVKMGDEVFFLSNSEVLKGVVVGIGIQDRYRSRQDDPVETEEVSITVGMDMSYQKRRGEPFANVSYSRVFKDSKSLLDHVKKYI